MGGLMTTYEHNLDRSDSHRDPESDSRRDLGSASRRDPGSDSGRDLPAGNVLTKPAAKAREGTPRLVVEIIGREDHFALMREEWNALALQAHVTVYQTHEWLSLWWKHFGSDGSRALHIVVVRHNKEIV